MQQNNSFPVPSFYIKISKYNKAAINVGISRIESTCYGLQVPSYLMLGISKHVDAPPTPQRPLSPLGEACSRKDLTAIHQILVMTHYRDDEGTNEVLEW